ncbi:MAG TPA: nuclear transport factor 2 family protein [Rheinheimera sp.]|nr:nuclear transport factor 2 family protein [Rheinheimera sp.]
MSKTPDWLAQFVAFYNQLNSKNLATLETVYDTRVQFIDPVHSIQGRDALQRYFQHAYERLNYSRFEVKHAVGDEERGFLSWQMQFAHPAIGGGQPQLLDGCSELVRGADGKVHYHRDYYDLTQLVYQHVPVLSWMTAKVKQKMAQA